MTSTAPDPASPAGLAARWGAAPKGFTVGTHRMVDPAATLSRVESLCPVFGITRIADVTGLDHIGIPVVMVCRPNSRSLAVSQGKGPTRAAARASGLMESVESWHAERILHPLLRASTNELRFTHPLIALSRLPRPARSQYHPDRPMLWIQGEPLGGGERRWLPYEAVHLDFRVPGPEGDGAFFNTSNGLASGNARLEAISHAICELIERDASAQHRAHPEDVRRRCRVDLSTIDDPVCLDILARYDASDIAVAVWEVTTDIGLPVFECLITDRVENPLRALATCFGAGCHPARQVALLRALTEAAQSRLTAIAGSRDDEGRREYARVRAGPTRQRLRALVSDTSHAHRDFHRAPTIDHGSQEEDVAWILARLRRVGLDEVLVVDLSREGIDIPVVKVVIPGLEVSPDMAGYTPGPRARAAMEAR